MKRKHIILNIILICIAILSYNLIITVNAENSSQIIISSSKNSVASNEAFTILLSANNTNIAAYTLWIYYESEKVECISQIDNINIQENTIIYTWYSGNGKNKSLDKMLEIEFTPKQEGNVTFSVVGKFYNENGEEIAIQGNTLDILVGDKNLIVESQNEEEASLLYEVQNDDNSVNLGIMRTNNEGINPDFDEATLKALISGYMKLGGIQMQITCTSAQTLMEAYENPDVHKNLVVRVGGYSEYFQKLSDELKKMVINRNIQKMV